MIGSELWAEIVRLRHVEQLSRAEIGRRLGIHRTTVTAALASGVAPRYERQPRGTIVAARLPMIPARLREYPDIFAARLLEELRPRGYTGGYTAPKEALRELRPKDVEAGDALVAEHLRCFDRHVVIEEPGHIRRLLERKRAARAVKARDLLLDLCAECKPYLEGLLGTGRHLDTHITRIGQLVVDHGPAAVGAAISEALARRLFGAGYVEQLLRRPKERAPRVPVSVPTRPEVAQNVVQPHRLEDHEEAGEGGLAPEDPPA